MSISFPSAEHQSVDGFLLTRQVYDTKQGIELSFWYKTTEGPVNVLVKHEKAILFVEATDSEKAKSILLKNTIALDGLKVLTLQTFNQKPVVGLYFSSMRMFYLAREALNNESIKCYEDDIRPDDRYLMERFITASAEIKIEKTLNYQRYYQTSKFPIYQCDKARSISAKQTLDKISLSMVSIDIECAMSGELYSIGLYSHDLHGKCVKKILMIGDQKTSVNSKKLIEEETLEISEHIIWVKNEKALLEALVVWVVENDPDIFIGWNVIQFDFALLQKRCDFHQIDFVISLSLIHI